MALGLTPTTLSFIQGNGSPAPSAGVTDVLQNGSSVVDNGVARVTVPVNTSDLQNDSGFITAADIPAIPTKTSELQNDSGFVTSSAIPTKTSDLQNDSGFVTAGDIRQLPASTSADSGEVLTVDSQGNPGWAPVPSPVVSGVQDVTVDGVSVVTQGVAAITMPSVPTKTSQLQNDSGFVTSSAIPTKTSDLQNDSGFITSSSLPTVDQTYNSASTNAQSGVAVAQAIASVTPGGGGTTLNHLHIESNNQSWTTVANKEIAQVTYSAAFKFTFGSAPSDVIPVSGYSVGIVRINIENYLPPYATFDSVVLQMGRNITVKSSNVQNSVSYLGGVLDRFQIADIPYFCSTGFGGDYDLYIVFLNNGTPVLPGRFSMDIIRLY